LVLTFPLFSVKIAGMKEISGGVCAPKGFKAGGIWCGIKAG
jgi:hypothetical protein